LVLQTEAAECALACLAMIARYHGHNIDLISLRARFSTSLKGAQLNRVIQVANSLGLSARALRAELSYLSKAQVPCILHWDLNHFVVLKRVRRGKVEIYDPANGRRVMSLTEASAHFTGVILELETGEDFEPIDDRRTVSLRSIAGKIPGLKRSLGQVFVLAVAIEILALIVPFQLQWTLDQVLQSDNQRFLIAATVIFLGLLGLATALNLARAWMLSWLGASVNAQWVSQLFEHMLKLPLEYFEKRHIGDVISRFGSVQAVQNTVTGTFVQALLDGLMGVLALVILCVYSAPLTFVVLTIVLIYTVLRLCAYRELWRANEEQLTYAARQQSELMESVRGIQAIKLANKQAQRRARLVNATVESSRRVMRSQRISLAFGIANQSLFGAQRIALVAFGAYLALKGRFSVGMLVAYVAYADQFATKISSLVDKAVDLSMLRLHAERIGDIASASPEAHEQGNYEGHEPTPSIAFKDVSFRYAPGEPWVLRHLSMNVSAGESVAIVGPSGCGKTTLGKLLVGLLEPTEGSIEVGEIDIRAYGLENFRRMASAVMQDDTLFAGSIVDNVTLFDQAPSHDDVVAAVTSASLHDEISAMPMGYRSTVGDMGSALSGGQRQRLLLARALYRKPKILLLDEATSHLDSVRESLVNEAIMHMQITRIVIAHREGTIASADRIIRLGDADEARVREPMK